MNTEEVKERRTYYKIGLQRCSSDGKTGPSRVYVESSEGSKESREGDERGTELVVPCRVWSYFGSSI